MKQILCFGDSNTWGYNPQDGSRFDWGIRWTSILQQRMEYDNVRIIEEGLCGRTSVFEDELRPGRRGMDVLPFLLESHTPLHTVIIMLGTNDCKSIYHANETIIGRGVESLIRIVQSMQPTAKILLISPIHLGDSVWTKEFDPEFDEHSVTVSYGLKEAYESVARKTGVEFLAASDYASYSLKDMEHMDEESHRQLAEAIYLKLNKRF